MSQFKDRPFVIVAGIIGLLVIAYGGWYLASPLFVNDVVNEAFPFEMPTEAEVAGMSDTARANLEKEFMEAMPSEEDLVDLTEEEKTMVEDKVSEAAAIVMMDKEMAEEMPAGADTWIKVGQGEFMDADSFHQGSGTASIYQQGDKAVLRFEEFDVTNGPDLHVVLSTHPQPTNRNDLGEDHIDLGSLKGNQGNQNYEIPTNIDLSQYHSVVIYCQPFHVVFATATLN